MNPEEHPPGPDQDATKTPQEFDRGFVEGFTNGFSVGVESKKKGDGGGGQEKKDEKEGDKQGQQDHDKDAEPVRSSKPKNFETGFETGFVKGFEKATGKDETEKKGDEDEKGKKEQEDKKDKRPLFKRPVFVITAIVVLVVLIAGVILLWLILRQYVSTDDAYIDGYVTQVSPRAAAQVQALHVQDNQYVHKGDLLVELDPTDYQVALDQAKAQVVSSEGRLTQAEAQIETANASVNQAVAEVDAAQVQLDNADKDLRRYQEVDERARSRQQLDNAETTEKNAAAQLKQAEAKKASADADVHSSQAAVAAAQGELQTSEASRQRAEVNLSYCKVFAPTDGRVTQRTVDVGNYVAIGQAMFLLADPQVWVTANFKETQLTHMRIGQPVTVKVDAYPGQEWRAHVDSIQAGSGSRFSILPAENATGNFVKVVQRVPVKIIFDEAVNTNNDVLLSAGLSVIPRVKVR